MALDCTPDDTALAVAEMYAEAGELPGYDQHFAETAIADYLEGLRTVTAQQRWLNEQLAPFGFFAVAVQVRRAVTWH